MRLLMINNEFPPLGGGTATANWMLFRELAKRPEVSVDLVTATAGAVREEVAFSDNIRLIRLPVGIRDIHHAGSAELLRFAWRARGVARALHRAHPYDAALAWHAVPAALPLLPLRWFHKLPFLIRVGGADIPGFEKRYERIYPFLKPVLKTLWKASSGVIVKSRGEHEMIRRAMPSLEPAIIPNGVDTDMFTPAATPRPAAGPLRVLCVARLIHRKGQDQLIRAVATLAREGLDLELLLAGGGDARAEYETLSRDLNIAARIRFLGEIAREDLPALYRDADLFAMTSFNEGMSNAMLEAMASGLPVLVTRTAGTGEVVDHDENGWTVDWMDEPGLTALLRHAAGDRARLQTMGAAARRKATLFSWRSSCDAYLNLLRPRNP